MQMKHHSRFLKKKKKKINIKSKLEGIAQNKSQSE
jgi:hypothetical protein